MRNTLFKGVVLFLILVFTAPAADAGDREIHIITPQWEHQTNPDGSGLFFEIIREVYQPEGIEMKWQFAPWKRSQTMVSSAKSDAMLCVWQKHAEEEGQLIPRYPMYVEHTAVVYKRDSIPAWDGIHSLDYKRAVWLRGYDYHTFDQLKSVQFGGWHEVDTHENAWRQLNLDRFDVYIDALIDIDIFIKDHQVDMSLYRKRVLWDERAYISFSDTPRSRELIRIFDRRIKELFHSGDLERIYRNWDQPFFRHYWEE